MKEPRDIRAIGVEARLFPQSCVFCGGSDREDNPLVSSTWGLPWVSRPFPAHRGCAEDYLYERVTEQEMREQLQ